MSQMRTFFGALAFGSVSASGALVLAWGAFFFVPQAALADDTAASKQDTKKPTPRRTASPVSNAKSKATKPSPRRRAAPRKRPKPRQRAKAPTKRPPAPRKVPLWKIKRLASKAYFRGLKTFQAKDWTRAKAAFAEALGHVTTQWARAKEKRQKRRLHILALGRCDLMYWLARSELKLSQPLASCRRLHKLQQTLSQVPKGWQKWSVHPKLPGRMAAAQKRYAMCAKVPSRLSWEGLPKGAVVEVFAAPKGGTKGAWKARKVPLEVVGGQTLRIRLQAPGYKVVERAYQVPRWEQKVLTWSMEKLPPPPRRRKVVAVVAPPPRPRVAPKKKGLPLWAWIAIGAGAGVVVTTTIVVAAVASQGIDEVEPVIQTGDTP